VLELSSENLTNFNYTVALPERNTHFRKKSSSYDRFYKGTFKLNTSAMVQSNFYRIKFNRFGFDSKSYMRCQGEEFHKNCIKPTVKGGDGSILVWGFMTAKGTGLIEYENHGQIRVFEHYYVLFPFAEKYRRMDLSSG